MNVSDLTIGHIGRKFTITAPRRYVLTGILFDFDATADQIEEHALCDPDPYLVAGRTTARLNIGGLDITAETHWTIEETA